MEELYEVNQYSSTLLEFYRKNKISPVRQNIVDLESHFRRRRFLYHYLGIPPNLFENKKIIEFGPGSGHNALYVTSCNPKKYILVDGNEIGINDCKTNMSKYFPKQNCLEFIHSRIEDYSSNEKFDIVLCEGVITHHPRQNLLLQHVAKNVKNGGVLVFTCSDYISDLAEILRKLIALYFMESQDSIHKQVTALKDIFSPHLDTLKGMSRLYEDWILDNLIQQWKHPLFNIKDAIITLNDDFYVYGSSPKFLTDWRWYKDIGRKKNDINKKAIENYNSNVINFIDYRISNLVVDDLTSSKIQKHCEEIYWIMIESAQDNTISFYPTVAKLCNALKKILYPISLKTAQSLEEAEAFFNHPSSSFKEQSAHFSSWFGCSQQYISCVKA